MANNVNRLLSFAVRYPGWHTCGADSRRAMRSLEDRGLLIVARYPKAPPQFRLALPDYAREAIDKSGA